MKTARILYQLALSDFRERTRRYSYLIVLGLIGYLGYLVNIGDFSVKLGNTYRGVYNSAWVGAQMTLVINFVLGLLGFFLVKNSVDRDTQTGVGQIIATTPLKGRTYLFGKWLSHLAVLYTMVILMAIASVVMQLIYNEAALDVVTLWMPVIVIALPTMALTAALASFFEAIPFLRGSIGNLVYFGVWLILFTIPLSVSASGIPFPDPIGIGTLIPSARTALLAQYPDAPSFLTINTIPASKLVLFQWNGVTWTASNVLPHAGYVVGGIVVVFIGSLFFERFDPSRRLPLIKTGKASKPTIELAPEAEKVVPVEIKSIQLSPLIGGRNNATFLSILVAEIKLLFKGFPWWWYAIAGAIIVGCVVAPLEFTLKGFLPAAWVWSTLVWSRLGCREQLYDTRQLVFSAVRPLWRQLPATWLAGIVITAAIGVGGALAFLIHGEWSLIASWVATVLFIPSLALAFGVWSGSNRLFEIAYFLWWYAGPAQGNNNPLNFVLAPAPMYLSIAVILMIATIVGRAVQLRK